MSAEDLCPPYWPDLLWRLRRRPPPPPDPDGWPIIEDILVSLQTYAMTYVMKNQQIGLQIREFSIQELAESVKNLGKGISGK